MPYEQKPGSTSSLASGGQYDDPSTTSNLVYGNLAADSAASAGNSANIASTKAAEASASAATASTKADEAASSASTANLRAAQSYNSAISSENYSIQAAVSATSASNSAILAANNSRLSVGTTTTGAAGSNAVVSITGPAGSQLLNLTIPRGNTGDTGAQGPQGIQGVAGPVGPAGPAGDDGRGIVSVIRTSGTGAAGTTDTYTITYTDSSTSTFNVYNGSNGTGTGDMLKSENLLGLTDYAAARSNLGLGTAATTNASAYATATQGAKADTAVQPNTTPTLTGVQLSGATGGAGVVTWDDGNGTAQLTLKGGNTTLQIGQETVARVYNDSGVALTDGQIVYISGAQGNRVAVKLARADVDATSAGTLGMVTEPIPIGGEGFITILGTVNNLNTSGLTAGSLIYLSGTTAGAYTTTKPTAPVHTVILGYVERVHATVGSIYIKVDNGYELDELHDVATTSAAPNDFLVRNASNLWVNQDPATARTSLGLGTAATTNSTDYASAAAGLPTGGTTGQVLAKTSNADYADAWTSIFSSNLTNIQVVSALPGSPDANTLYIVTG